jgi:hypothetical protein
MARSPTVLKVDSKFSGGLSITIIFKLLDKTICNTYGKNSAWHLQRAISNTGLLYIGKMAHMEHQSFPETQNTPTMKEGGKFA